MVNPLYIEETSFYSVVQWLYAVVFSLNAVVSVLYTVFFSIICSGLSIIWSG